MTPEIKASEKIKNIRKNKIRIAKLRIDTLFVLLFVLFIIVMGVMFFLLPKKKESEREKRKLMSFPEFSVSSILDGSYTNNINLYYSDNFVLRDSFVDAKYKVSEARGVKVDDITIIGSDVTGDIVKKSGAEDYLYNLSPILLMKDMPLDDVLPEISFENITVNNESTNISTENAEQLNSLLNINEEELQGEKRGSLYVVGDTALEIFYGSEAVSKKYAAVINQYSAKLGPGVTIYNMIVPNHFEYGLPEKYKGKVGRDQKPFIDTVKNNLNENVIFVDIHSYIKEHYEKGEYLYFRTDHHWTGLGAYRAYEVFCRYANLKPIPLDSYEKRVSYGFLGTFYSSSMNSELASNPDYVEYYVSDLPYVQTNTSADGSTYSGRLIADRKDGKTNGYLTFMGGDIPLATIKTENTNGKKIIVFKESYGNAFIPFIVPHYEYVYVADIRSFPYNSVDFIKNNGIGEVLFINNIMASNTDARVANIYMLMEK